MSNQELRQRRSRNNPRDDEDKKRREDLALQQIVNAIREPSNNPEDSKSDARTTVRSVDIRTITDEWWLI